MWIMVKGPVWHDLAPLEYLQINPIWASTVIHGIDYILQDMVSNYRKNFCLFISLKNTIKNYILKIFSRKSMNSLIPLAFRDLKII